MKERLQRLATRVDALTLRERVLLFAAIAAACVFLMHFFGLEPMLAKQELLRAQIVQQQNQLEGIDNEIGDKVKAAQVDPDAPTRERIAAVRAQLDALATSLRAMQNGLVPPERMAPLVEAILRANGRLQLVSLRTLPVEPIEGKAKPQAATTAATADTPVTAKPAATADTPAAAGPAALLYRHGVEVTVRGNYLDMIGTMAALESMPTRLFWGAARLEAETWPSSRLTLTLYTLSLDAQWMKL
jgi:MSHA biogenesis protein MshJ